MKKKYLFFRSLLLVVFLLGLNGKAFSQDKGDNTGVIKVGEEIFQRFESPHPYVASLGTNETKVWTQNVKYEQATYISLHFSKLQLAPDDFLLIKSVDGERSWKYYNRGNYNKHDPTKGFWSVPIYGNELIIEIHSANPQQDYGYSIDKFARGFTRDEMNTNAEDDEAICGDDDSREAKCYQNSEPEVYDHSRAVARLLINGTGACTGWLIGDEGHLMTNNHCVESVSDANNVTVEFMAEGSSCSTNCESWFGCPGIIEASSTTLVRTDANLDYSLLALPSNVSGTYGFLQLRETGAAVGERIYIPQHPRAWGKRIALESDHNDDSADGFAHVQAIDEPRCGGSGDDVGYYADTQGGSSGSPVLGYDDHLVIALHHCANCPNRGVPIQEIIDDLGDDLPNNSVPDNCIPEELVDFHFEHEDGSEDTEFYLCEDVYMDGSATVNTGSYFIDIWKVNGNGTVSWLSAQGTNGWAQGSPDLVNITQLFENDVEHPVTFQAGVTYEVKLAISHPQCGWISVKKRFTYLDSDGLVDFHFEHENGTTDTEFNLCEDVYMDGSATTNTGSYFIDIWRVNGNGTVSWLSAQGSNGWAQGSPDLVNITQLFVNDAENPVTFQAGVTYEVKLAISHPDCGWVSETRRFTYTDAQMSSGFDIVDYYCYDGVFDVTLTAHDSAPSQWWRVYETSVEGSTTDANTIGSVSSIQGDTTVTFTELDPTRFYYIKHGVYTSNCSWQETRIPLSPDCCDEFDSADFSVGVDFNYNFWVGNYEGYEDLGATHEWYVLSSPNPTGGPYTPEFSTTTTGGSNFPLFTGGQFGVYYTIVHKVVSYCGEICYAQVQYQKEGEAVKAENSAVAAEVDCCLVFDYWPNGPGEPQEFTAKFDIGIDPQTGTIQTYVGNTYPNNPSITHEWTLFSSPNETGGPYTLVDESDGANYSYTAAQNGVYYFLFHKVKSECGEVCFAQTICRNCGEESRADCEFCGVIDCSLIDELTPKCEAPTSLVYTCKTAKLSWAGDAGANYVVEVNWDDPNCCRTDKRPTAMRWNVRGTGFQLPYINQSGCFSWRVGVKCEDGTIEWSNLTCASCFTKPHDDGPTKPNDVAADVKTSAKISPNPNDGNMNIEVSGKDKTDFTLQVYRFDGILIKTFNNNRIENRSININWNGKSVLTPGMYFFVITTDSETITKKVVIK